MAYGEPDPDRLLGRQPPRTPAAGFATFPGERKKRQEAVTLHLTQDEARDLMGALETRMREPMHPVALGRLCRVYAYLAERT